MTDTNRVRMTFVRETTLGTTPNSPRMRGLLFQQEGLSHQPVSVTSDAIRDDRMDSDPIKVGEEAGGTVGFEVTYPVPGSAQAAIWESAFCNTWADTPNRDNDGTAGSQITGVASGTTVSVASGAGFVVGHLVRQTGFGQAANNGLFPVTTGGTSSYVSTGAGFATEALPAAAARAKVVGFQGVAGDITASATGLASTTLNFTTLGLAVGQPIKIGGTGSAFRFAQEALNGYARIAAIAANALTLDNLPAGWAVDAGTGRTIRVFFGDRLRNGTQEIGLTNERAFLGQAIPSYVVLRGLIADRMELTLQRRQKLTASVTFVGMSGAVSATPLSATPDPAPPQALFPVIAAGAHVGRVNEAGARLSSPNWVERLGLSITNAVRRIEAVDSMTAVDLGLGTQQVSVAPTTYFGDSSLYAKVLALTPTTILAAIVQGSRALVLQAPRVTPTAGNPNASGRSQDAMLPLQLAASASAEGFHLGLDRLEYVEA